MSLILSVIQDCIPGAVGDTLLECSLGRLSLPIPDEERTVARRGSAASASTAITQ